MSLSAATNTTANTALRYLQQNSAASASSLAKLSSGSRIVKASDDAASLAVGTKIRADITALKQAQVNTSQATAVLQVADGALNQTTDVLMRMKALAAQASSGQVGATERGFINAEYQQMQSQLTDIGNMTTFNGTKLLDGTYKQSFVVGVAAADDIEVDMLTATGAGFNVGGIATTLSAKNLLLPADAGDASALLDTAITNVNTARANIGAYMSRFDSAGATIANTVENLDAARSTLLDVDMAAEMSNFSSKQVMMQASVAMLAQANQQPQQLLRLLN